MTFPGTTEPYHTNQGESAPTTAGRTQGEDSPSSGASSSLSAPTQEPGQTQPHPTPTLAAPQSGQGTDEDRSDTASPSPNPVPSPITSQRTQRTDPAPTDASLSPPPRTAQELFLALATDPGQSFGIPCFFGCAVLFLPPADVPEHTFIFKGSLLKAAVNVDFIKSHQM